MQNKLIVVGVEEKGSIYVKYLQKLICQKVQTL